MYPRVEVSFPVECEVLPGSAYFYTVSKDISLAGIKIISDKFMSNNDIVKLQANFINVLVGFIAKVVWCRKQRVSERYYTGLAFTEKNSMTQRHIQHFLHNIEKT